MFKTFLSLIICIGFLQARGQQKELDSLLLLLQKNTREDSARLAILNEIIYAYHTINPDKGLETADEAILLSKKLNYPLMTASAYSNKGVNYWAKGDDSLAMEMYKYSLQHHQQNGNQSGVARMYNNIGLLYFNKSEFYQALDYHQKSLDIFTVLKDSNRIANIQTNIAIDYHYLSNYQEALNHYMEAMKFYEHHKDVLVYGNGLANTYSSMGLVYKAIGQYETSITYYNKALAIYQQLQNKQGEASVYGNLGVVHSLVNKVDEAIAYYSKALIINQSIGNPRRIASDLSNLAEANLKQQQYDHAYANLYRAQKIYDSTGDRNNLSVVLSQMGDLFLSAPPSFLQKQHISPAKRYVTALTYQYKALELATAIGALTQQGAILENISDTYESAGDPAKALAAFKQHVTIKDSVMNDSKRLDMAKMEARFDYENKEAALAAEHEKQVALLEAKADKQRIIKNGVVTGIIALILAAIGGYILYKKKRDVEILQKQTRLNAQVAETEMKALRAQMNPHFIFNSLNSISDFISKNNIAEADNYLTQFAKLIRLILEHSGKKQISLQDDLQALQIYMELEAKRLNKPFSYEIVVEEGIDSSVTLVPPLLIQPFVENSIWHGFSSLPYAGHIKIMVSKKEDVLKCIVEDNGIGRKKSEQLADKKNKQESLGMKITKERIDVLNITGAPYAAIHLVDKPDGVRVEIDLPWETTF